MTEKPTSDIEPGVGARLALGAIWVYRHSLSAVMGRQCRHMPSCSEYTADAIRRHGAWAGSWIGLARICRCNPWGTSGIDWVADRLPPEARWFTPWRYGRWRGTHVPACEPVTEAASDATRR